ncbi:unnamed protein product [Trichogramma brassicae]|uniref:Lactate/malate dehydrogenase C-terminal domain-containing protein n=1 Tax=Trichogramma brassicae TaxID=86971 RepID=A0A6H5HYA8_9HYME|nr:unnamed protein product [Trichogramma brassicae]
MAKPITVVVTGAAGQIAYSLLYQLAAGSVFGEDQPIDLRLLDIPPMMGVLEGVIFKVQGEALDKFAKKDVKVLVVGNPANTNALICSHYAPSIPKENFTAMTRLDQNRAQAALASRIGVSVDKVKNVIIWGNHSSTQYPDAAHATVDKDCVAHPVSKAINDDAWLNGEFVETIQKRGAAVIAARKMSSAMSAAKAAGDHMRDWWFGTKSNQFVSMGVVSDGSYGIPKDVVFSLPVTIKDKKYTIVQVNLYLPLLKEFHPI